MDKKEIELKLREKQGVLSELKSLISHKGWKRLEELLKEQQYNREREIMINPLESMHEILKQEYNKGYAQGIFFTAALPKMHIAALENDIENLTRSEEKTNAQRNEYDRTGSPDRDGNDTGDFEPAI